MLFCLLLEMFTYEISNLEIHTYNSLLFYAVPLFLLHTTCQDVLFTSTDKVALLDIHLSGMDLQDSSTGLLRWCGELYLSVETSRPEQCWVENVHTVCCCYHLDNSIQ